MSQTIILPVLLPFLSGAMLLLVPPNQHGLMRTIGFAGCAALVGVGVSLFGLAAGGTYVVYPLGG